MYAQLCRKLCEEAPNFEPAGSTVPTFRRLLLKKCQDEFENRSKASEIYEKKDGPLSTDEEEQRTIAKHKMLGNIKFVGELGKLDMLHESILHKCIKQLLEKKKRYSGVRDMAEDLECLCQIMRTVGRSLDIEKAKSLMDQYFGRMKTFAAHPELQSRIRFMLQDVVELRENKWIPRKVLTDHGPKTISQIRQDAAKDFGFYIPTSQNSLCSRGNNVGSHLLYRGNMKSRGGMDDVFGSMPLGAANLGTGPGVISTDHFNGYSSNLGRSGRSNLNNPGSFMLNNPQQQLSQNTFAAFQNRQNSSMTSSQASLQNQTSSGSQQQQFTSGGKEVPPRFMKKNAFPGNLDEISLRPVQNSMMQLKPKVPSSLPKSAVPSSLANSLTNNVSIPDVTSSQVSSLLQSATISQRGQQLANPLLQKEAPILIKQANSDKNKSNKKEQGLTKAEAIKKMEWALESLTNNSSNVEDILSNLRTSKIPKKFSAELVTHIMTFTLDKTDNERELVSQLLTAMKKDGIIFSNHFMEGLKAVFQQINEREAEIPRVKSHVAGFLARAVVDDIVNLTDVAEPLDGGVHYPLFLLCLQQLHKLQGKQWLGQIFNESKVNLLNMLPECDQNKERLLETLEDRGLSFLFPLLRIQADLTKQIQSDPNPGVFYKWVKENVDTSQHTVPGFINAVVTCLIRHITQETTLAEGADTTIVPDKALQEKERDLLEKYKPVFQAFLHDHINLQAVALYALQVHCYNNNFPKGMLLRWFVMLYDMEVIEEEAFLKWKEDVTDDYPGKGKALFQVNQWLTWLEEAEEEEEEASDDGDN